MPGSLTGTYRLQLRAEFGFDAAAAVVPYLAELGVSHVYLSPVLQAVPGSAHGYDVLDHSQLSADLGGQQAFDRLVDTAHAAGLGLVVDVVPNHMAVPVPESLSTPLWSVLRHGPGSPYAGWFDVDWSTPDRALLMPVLGRRIGQVLDAGELVLESEAGEGPVLAYFDHRFPVRPGTDALPLLQLVDTQWYRLAHWKVGDEELNYRRFFDVDTLAALRVEDPAVFEATHRLLLDLAASGDVDGFRVDHPDGLADPRGYLRSLAAATGGAWVVVEKILEGEERLPADWPCAGTTGYDALNRVLGLFLDPAGEEPLGTLWRVRSDDDRGFAEVLDSAKRYVLDHSLRAEVSRLAEVAHAITMDDVTLRDMTRRGLTEALVELLVAMPRYRAYVVPGEEPPAESVEVVDEAVARAAARVPDRVDELALLRDLALHRLGVATERSDERQRGAPATRGAERSDERGARATAGAAERSDEGQRGTRATKGAADRLDEFCVRFQQTCGPVMAKGAEDTAFYRWHRLSALNEVGGDPARWGYSPDDVHGWAADQQSRHPLGMTTLSTHDTKRSEDVRARLAVLAEMPDRWATALASWREAAERILAGAGGLVDGATEYLLWQTMVGAWPISGQRLAAYLDKATHEAKQHTSWTAPDPHYDAAVRELALELSLSRDVAGEVDRFVTEIAPYTRVNVLSQRLVALMLPGVPDVYQGCDLLDLSLVDPDNRRPIDFDDRRERLRRLDAAAAPQDLSDEKLLVVSRALRLRRTLAGALATYAPLPTTSAHAFGFLRGAAVAVLVTRLPAGLERGGGWGTARAVLPAGTWRDTLTGVSHEGGDVTLAEMFERLPVALLTR